MGLRNALLFAILGLTLWGCTPAGPVLDPAEAVPLAQSQEFAVKAEVRISRAPGAISGGQIIIDFELKSLLETTLEEGNVALWVPDSLRKAFPDTIFDTMYELRPNGTPKVDLKPGTWAGIGATKGFSDYSQADRVRRIFAEEPSYVQVTWKGGKRTLEIPGSVWQIRVDE